MTSPLTALSGYVVTSPDATPEQRSGGAGTLTPPEMAADRYPWQADPTQPHGPYGTESGLLGVDIATEIDPAGFLAQDPTADLTPLTHAAPWPKGVPQSNDPTEVTARAQEMADIHSANLGGSRAMLYDPTAEPVNDEWVGVDHVSAGQSQQADIPDQLKGSTGGFGSTDRVQSFARQNQYGFDSAHVQHRYANGKIPGNFLWQRPGGRPLQVNVSGQNMPTGVSSPFAGQDTSRSFDTQGAALAVIPAEYEAPPDPALAPGYPAPSANTDACPVVSLW